MALVQLVAADARTTPDKWLLSDWPVAVREDEWVREVNRPQTEAELAALRRSVQRGQPYGDEVWVERVARVLGDESVPCARPEPGQERVELGNHVGGIRRVGDRRAAPAEDLQPGHRDLTPHVHLVRPVIR